MGEEAALGLNTIVLNEREKNPPNVGLNKV
jgi:hypothetical protein